MKGTTMSANHSSPASCSERNDHRGARTFLHLQYHLTASDCACAAVLVDPPVEEKNIEVRHAPHPPPCYSRLYYRTTGTIAMSIWIVGCCDVIGVYTSLIC